LLHQAAQIFTSIFIRNVTNFLEYEHIRTPVTEEG